MTGMSEAISIIKAKLPQERLDDGKQFKQFILEDEDIQNFIEDNQLSEMQVNTYMSVFANYVRDKSRQKLIYSNGIIDLISMVDPEQNQRLVDKVSRSFLTDSHTDQFKGLKFSEIEVDEHNELLVNSFNRLVVNYRYKGNTVGIWLHGRFGRGKSYLMGALANELHAKGAGVTFMTVNSLIDGYFGAIKDNRTQAYLDRIKRAEILILDDIGAEHVRDAAVKMVLYEVINYRANNQLLTFATSNLTIQEYEDFLKSRISLSIDAERLTERFEMLMKEVRLTGENRRVKA